jgi:hypothetical protein
MEEEGEGRTAAVLGLAVDDLRATHLVPAFAAGFTCSFSLLVI